MTAPAGTFSIVAADPTTGEVGCAVQSRYFAIGAVTPWGDRRGQQAAALVVEQLGAAGRSRERIDRICDLRVDDHSEPIVELRRLVGLWRDRQTF